MRALRCSCGEGSTRAHEWPGRWAAEAIRLMGCCPLQCAPLAEWLRLRAPQCLRAQPMEGRDQQLRRCITLSQPVSRRNFLPCSRPRFPFWRASIPRADPHPVCPWQGPCSCRSWPTTPSLIAPPPAPIRIRNLWAKTLKLMYPSPSISRSLYPAATQSLVLHQAASTLSFLLQNLRLSVRIPIYPCLSLNPFATDTCARSNITTHAPPQRFRELLANVMPPSTRVIRPTVAETVTPPRMRPQHSQRVII